ncbi:MAG: hypothetical protein WC783_04220 [Candidatus Paceibacterota bacterium]|jgi:hypothetical protein
MNIPLDNLSKFNFDYYKLVVLAKATGADIHALNTRLGHISNSYVYLKEYGNICKDKDKLKRKWDMFRKETNKIQEEYGVLWNEYFERR